MKNKGLDVSPSLPNYLYHPPKAGTIPIVAYNPTPWIKEGYAYPPTVEVFRKIIECGFNAAMMGTTPAKTADGDGMNPGMLDGSLASMQGLDISAVVNAGAFCAMPYPNNGLSADVYTTVMVNFINKYKVNSQIWGWMIFDEPKFVNLFGFKDGTDVQTLQGIQDVAQTYNTYISDSPGKVTFFNLACTLKSDTIGADIADNVDKDTPLKKYYAYLSRINSTFKPALWSFDFYPVRVNPSTSVTYVLDEYYLYLEAFKAIANASGRPFWAYILSTNHDIYEETSHGSSLSAMYAQPTEGVLRFQAFSALAYGAQGIVYWTYGQTLNKKFGNGAIHELYHSAPVNSQNEITSTWYSAKKVNQEIKSMNDVFFGATCKKVVHVYNPQMMKDIAEGKNPNGVFENTTTKNGTFHCLEEVSVPSDGKGLMISYMTKGNSKFLVFVSHDPVNSQVVTASISMNYNWHFYETREEASDTEGTENASVSKTISDMAKIETFTLPPGGYKVLYFSDKT